MSTLYWLKVARKAKLYKQPEFPHIEALIESEDGQISDDYAMMAKIIPASIIGIGVIICAVAAFWQHSPWAMLATIPTGFLAVGTWYVLDKLDKRIPRSRVSVRVQTKAIAQRVCGFSNLVGVEPALSSSVGAMIDEAARIYMKHRIENPNPVPLNSREKAASALEDAMARMLQLAAPDNARSQDAELEKGWAWPLLQEMRDMDVALDRQTREEATQPVDPNDALAQLREARMELLGTETALDELRQNLNGS